MASDNDVRVALAEDAAAWDEIAGSHPGATPFHAFAWRRAVEALGHRCLYLLQRGGGVLPLAEVNTPLGRRLVSVPGASYGSVLTTSSLVSDALGEEAVRLARDRKAACIELRSLSAEAPAGFTTLSPWLTVVVPAGAARKKEVRRHIRRAEAAGLSLHPAPRLDDFYLPYLAAVERLGSPPFGRRFFRAILDAFGARAHVYVGMRDGRPCASELWLDAGRRSFSTYGGATPAGRACSAGHWLLHQRLLAAEAQGLESLDLGRSFRGSPALAFKEAWGGRALPVYFQTYGEERGPADPAAPIMRAASAIWRRLPPAITRRAGPRVVRWLH